MLRHKLARQKTNAVVTEKSDDCQRAEKNDGGIAANKTRLQETNHAAGLGHGPAQAMQKSVDNFRVKEFPKPLARADFNWINDRGIVDFIHVIFVFQNAGQLQERTLLENHPTNANATKSHQKRQDRQETLFANLFLGRNLFTCVCAFNEECSGSPINRLRWWR